MKEWVIRALRTFLQAAIGAVTANVGIYITDIASGDESLMRTALWTLAGLAISAGVAAIMNLHPLGGSTASEDISEDEGYGHCD